MCSVHGSLDYKTLKNFRQRYLKENASIDESAPPPTKHAVKELQGN